MRTYRKLILLFVVACFTTAAAQSSTCGPFVQQALALAQQGCEATSRNQACYGYFALQATPREGTQNFSFAQQGDIVNVADLNTLQLSALDTVKNTWGIALMKLQANLPDSLPGQNVTFLLFGNVEIRNGVPAGTTTATAPDTDMLQPMQAFYFTTGVGGTNCAGAPADGIVIQTPQGAGQIKLRANNVDISLGSTAYIQAQPGASMNIRVVSGKGYVSSAGKTVSVPAGAQVEIPIDEDLIASDVPSDPEPYDAFDVEDLPIELLPDEIEIAEPADEATIDEAIDEIVYDETFEGDEATLDGEQDETGFEDAAQPGDEGEAPPDESGGEG